MAKRRRFKISDTIALCDEVDLSIQHALNRTFGQNMPASLMEAIVKTTSDAVAIALFYSQTDIRRCKA